jgi:hypothetical protein
MVDGWHGLTDKGLGFGLTASSPPVGYHGNFNTAVFRTRKINKWRLDEAAVSLMRSAAGRFSRLHASDGCYVCMYVSPPPPPHELGVRNGQE